MPKIQVNHGVTFVHIPQSKAKMAGYQKGDEVDFNFNQDGDLVISKVK